MRTDATELFSPSTKRSRPFLSRWTVGPLLAITPVAVLVSWLIPRHAPLDPLLVPLQAFFIGLFLYHLGLVAVGARRAEPVEAVAPRSRFAVLIAAHNEETVVTPLIESLRAQEYPRELCGIFVVADHCTDRTAEAARAAGAVAYERTGQARRGKGPAIEWLMARVEERDEAFDAVVIIDADNLAAPTFLQKMDAYLQRGETIIQGYLGVKNPHDSGVTKAIALSYAYTNRFFQLAKEHLGLSSALGGTGLCIATAVLRRLGWQCHSLTEDLEFQMRAILVGIRPAWGWEAVVYDEKPLSLRTAWQQRRRWMQGHANVAMRYLLKLLRRAIVARDPVAWDAVIYLASPVWLSLAALLSVGYIANSFGVLYTYLFPAWLPPALLLTSLIYPFMAINLEGLSPRAYFQPKALGATLLLAVGWPLLGLLGVLQHRNSYWVKTVHTRNLTFAQAARDQTKSVDAPLPGQFRFEPAKWTAAAMITLIAFATITPHLTARRLRPPLEEGAALLLNGEFELASQRFVAASEERPDDAVAFGFLALAKRLRGDRLGALVAYRQVRRLDPSLGDTVVAMVDFVMRNRSHPNRERLTREIISGVQSGPNAYAWVANLMIERRRLDDAFVLADDGLRHLGPQAVLLKVKGYVLLARRDFAEAISTLTWAARLTPRDPDILVNLGWAHFYRREPAVAVRLWEQALELDPQNAALRRDLERARRLLPS